MKLLTFIVLFSCGKGVLAQSQEQISLWLYALPIKEKPQVIKQALKNNSCFVDIAGDSISFAKYSFSGIILKPRINEVRPLDSTKIQLGLQRTHSTKVFNGFIKVLGFEYFSADTLYLDSLLNAAHLSLQKHSKKRLALAHNYAYNNSIGQGWEFIYKDNFEALSGIRILRLRHCNGAQSFLIQYEGSTMKISNDD